MRSRWTANTPLPQHPNIACPASSQRSTNVPPTHLGPTPLNAIPPHPTDPTQAQHRAENLAACLELRDLGLQLARAAAARALAAHEHQTHAPEPEAPEPQPTPKPADPDLAFARHSRSVRQSVELWEKITNNTFARRPQTAQEPSNFDPDQYLDELENHRPTQRPPYSEADRGNLYEAVANLALIHPDHAEIPETLDEIIEETLTAHPDDHVSANFARVCLAYDIEPDRTRLQPHLESQLRPPAHYPKRE